MKRRELLREIGTAANDAGVDWVFVRQGANHEMWRCGTAVVAIPRHREINERTATSILKDLADALGKDWWR